MVQFGELKDFLPKINNFPISKDCPDCGAGVVVMIVTVSPPKCTVCQCPVEITHGEVEEETEEGLGWEVVGAGGSLKNEIMGVRLVRLGDHPWLQVLTGAGHVWEIAGLDREIMVVATANDQEWACYYQIPHQDKDPLEVAEYGNKLPEGVARELFGRVHQAYRA